VIRKFREIIFRKQITSVYDRSIQKSPPFVSDDLNVRFLTALSLFKSLYIYSHIKSGSIFGSVPKSKWREDVSSHFAMVLYAFASGHELMGVSLEEAQLLEMHYGRWISDSERLAVEASIHELSDVRPIQMPEEVASHLYEFLVAFHGGMPDYLDRLTFTRMYLHGLRGWVEVQSEVSSQQPAS